MPGYLRRPAAGVKRIPPVAAGELRAVRRARPDLIVGRQGALFEGLSLIAPTVIVEPGSGRWKLNLRLMGEALGRTNDAEALLTDYDRRVASVRRAVQGRPRVAVVRAVEDGWLFAPRDSFAGTILADVGARQVASFRRADVVLLAQPESERVRLGQPGISPEDVELATWWGPGGVLEARAALADLREILRR
jgi:ABC-type Fe3+-hydroxamate transport system substrate-binding protein